MNWQSQREENENHKNKKNVVVLIEKYKYCDQRIIEQLIYIMIITKKNNLIKRDNYI